MSLPLDLGEQLVDRSKSSLYLYYLARATYRVMQREIAHKKVELAIKQLKKLSTKDLHKHVDELQGHILEAIHSEKQIIAHQKGEEGVHTELTHKITRLEGKLTKYLQSQEARKKRVQEIEEKIKHKFTTKQEKIKQLREDLSGLATLYHKIKKTKKYSPTTLLRVAKRMTELKEKISLLK